MIAPLTSVSPFRRTSVILATHSRRAAPSRAVRAGRRSGSTPFKSHPRHGRYIPRNPSVLGRRPPPSMTDRPPLIAGPVHSHPAEVTDHATAVDPGVPGRHGVEQRRLFHQHLLLRP